MLHAGLDLSRRRLDICLLDERGRLVAETAAPPDADGLHGLARRLRGERVRGVIESMNGARLVHDTLEEHGWEVLIADAQKVKGLAPLACKTDKIDARVLAELSWRDQRVRLAVAGDRDAPPPRTYCGWAVDVSASNSFVSWFGACAAAPRTRKQRHVSA